MKKLKITLTESQLWTLRAMLYQAIKRNPLEHLRQNPADFLVVSELTDLFARVNAKAVELKTFGVKATSPKARLTVTRSEAAALYMLLDSLATPEESSDLTSFEIAFHNELSGTIQRAYFV